MWLVLNSQAGRIVVFRLWKRRQRDEHASCSIPRIAINDYYFIPARMPGLGMVRERVVCGAGVCVAIRIDWTRVDEQ